MVDVRRRPLRLEARARAEADRPSRSARAAKQWRKSTQHRLGHRIEWSDAANSKSPKAVRKAGREVAWPSVLSPHLTVEEAYLLAKYVRGLDPEARCWCWGRCRSRGQDDETFKNGFTIRAEKCPNRRGVESGLRPLRRRSDRTFDDFLPEAAAGKLARRLGLAAATRNPIGSTKADAPACREGRTTLVVQDLFAVARLWNKATYQLARRRRSPSAKVVRQLPDRLQSFRVGGSPAGRAWVEGQLYWQLLKMPGLYKAAKVLRRSGRARSCFFAAAGRRVPPTRVSI